MTGDYDRDTRPRYYDDTHTSFEGYVCPKCGWEYPIKGKGHTTTPCLKCDGTAKYTKRTAEREPYHSLFDTVQFESSMYSRLYKRHNYRDADWRYEFSA